MEQVRAFALDRRAGTEGERTAAGLLAASFEQAGYQVDRTEVHGSPRARRLRLTLSWLAFGALFPAGLLAPRAFSTAGRVGLMASGL
ncbi:MAG: hypothetical protein LC745_06110, partial [Planctomycetia bacterium]|nr:hypothetical protein [Planctomycetia bacterium]